MIPKTKKVPKLRFPGFSGEWNEKKLGDMALKVGSGSTPRGGSKVYKKAGIPFVRSQNVTGGKLDMHDVVFIDEITHRSMANSAIQPNDVLLNITGASLGRTCVVPSDFKEGNLSQHVCIIRLNVTDPYLLHTILSKPRSLQELLKTQTGGGKEGLNFQAVRAFKLVLPEKNEQKKIAGFLGVVDDRISALQKKVELLQKYKKGIMQKIFPPAGGQSPQIRFAGFSEPWQEKKLGDIARKENSPISANEIESKTGPYKVFGASGFLQTLDIYDQAEEYLAIIKDGAGVGRLLWCEAKSSVLGTLNIIKPKANNNNKFLYYLLSMFNFSKYSIGSTIPHVYFKDYAKQKISVPNYEEQEKITEFLTSLDDKIDLTERKLEQAKKFKKALLQQMFV